jgi:hypothetical protein
MASEMCPNSSGKVIAGFGDLVSEQTNLFLGDLGAVVEHLNRCPVAFPHGIIVPSHFLQFLTVCYIHLLHNPLYLVLRHDQLVMEGDQPSGWLEDAWRGCRGHHVRIGKELLELGWLVHDEGHVDVSLIVALRWVR